MTLIGQYFNQFYGLLTAYKHGLLIFLGKHRDSKLNIICELDYNHLFNLLFIDAGPVVNNTECVIHIVHAIFNTIVDSLITNLVLEQEEQQKTNFHKKVNAVNSPPPGTSLKVDFTTFHIHTGNKKIPIYLAPKCKFVFQ